MIKFAYMDGGQEVVKEFEKYQEMLRFVATSRIKDEDFVKLQFGEDEAEDTKVIEGMDGLITEALETADAMDEADRRYEEFMESLNAEAEDSDNIQDWIYNQVVAGRPSEYEN